jgi:hypothetical protein
MKRAAGVYLGLVCLSAAPLALQVALTRLFALAQGHHFAFMAISLALLGSGASGTLLSLRPPQPHTARHWLSLSAALFALAVPASYLLVNVIPFDMYRIALEPAQLGWLALYYLVLTVPFLFSGLVVGAALVAWPEQVGRLYAANLLGAALGPPLALLGLTVLGGPRTVLALAWLGCLAFWLFSRQQRSAIGDQLPTEVGTPDRWGPKSRPQSGLRLPWLVGGLPALALVAVCAVPLLLPPAVTDIRLSPYHALSQVLFFPDSRIAGQTWNAFSRVDVVEGTAIRSAPGLSMAFRGHLPPQVGLIVDGQNLTTIARVPLAEAEYADFVPPALAYRLRPHAETLVIEPGGWLGVLTALRGGARHVTVVQSNPAMADAVRSWGAGIVDDARVSLVIEDARSYLHRERRPFDVVALPLSDSFRPVTAGAYALGEDHRYTVEAFEALWEHLSTDGLIVAERWLQLPPSESLRLWAVMVEALRRRGVAEPGAHLVALHSLQTSVILAARTPFDAAELAEVRRYTAARQYDVIWTPELPTDIEGLLAASDAVLAGLGINRYNVMPGAPHFKAFARLLSAPDAQAFYRDYEYAVAPPTDDRPFFFHFFKWQQTPAVLAALGKTWQPFGGSGYLVFVLLLALVLVLAALLIVLPLVILRRAGGAAPPERAGRRVTWRYLLYFSLLGLAFMLVEIPLLQHYILYVGQPAYAFAAVVTALLLASGLGSRYLSHRLPPAVGLAALAGLGLAYPTLLAPLFDATIGLPLAARAAVGGLALLPLGVLMGTPFPQGLARAHAEARHLLPWIWAVNGSASVVSAVLAPMLAIDLGFRTVMVLGALAYLAALPAAGVIRRHASAAQTPPHPS